MLSFRRVFYRPLRSTDITPLPRYSGPIRHPLAFPDLPQNNPNSGLCVTSWQSVNIGRAQALRVELR
jgi:hypothetical protein